MARQYYTRCTGILLVLACGLYSVLAFSDGTKLAHGNTATRRIYCHRSAATRKPLHFDSECSGFCKPRINTEQFYTMNVSAATYWLDAIYVNISAKPESGRSVTGFSIYALDEQGGVAGSFVEDDKDVTVGSCSDIMMYSEETHGAFHKMADRKRKNVTLQWQPDGFNHGPLKFVAWIVHNHSEVYYMESKPLACRRNGSYSLDLESTLHDLMAAIDLELFESTFRYRSKLGYHLDLDDPFKAFSDPPTEVDIVPLKTAETLTREINKLLSADISLGENADGEVKNKELMGDDDNDAMKNVDNDNNDDVDLNAMENLISAGGKDDGDKDSVDDKDKNVDDKSKNDDLVDTANKGSVLQGGDDGSVNPTADLQNLGIDNTINSNKANNDNSFTDVNKINSGDGSSIYSQISDFAVGGGDDQDTSTDTSSGSTSIVNDNPKTTTDATTTFTTTSTTAGDTTAPADAPTTSSDTTDTTNPATTADITITSTTAPNPSTTEAATVSPPTPTNGKPDEPTATTDGSFLNPMNNAADKTGLDNDQPMFIFPF